MKELLMRSPSQNDLIQVLQAWRIWLLTTLIGALIGYALFLIFPPDFRARATINVDQNLEQAWPKADTERELMTYLSRETQKLVELAWSDATLQMVVDQNPDTSISKLRSGVLQLSQPSDGAWHFWANNPDAEKATWLASAWAKAFYERSLQGIEIAIQIQALQASLLETPNDPDAIKEQIINLEPKSMSISPYLQITLSQGEQIPVGRTSSQISAILAGAAVSGLLTLLGLLFIGSKNLNRGNP
jgi:hypothetical protein